MSDEEHDDLVLSGVALRAIVRLAETPGTGEIVRNNLAASLGLDELFELDLREFDPEPAAMPHHPLTGGYSDD